MSKFESIYLAFCDGQIDERQCRAQLLAAGCKPDAIEKGFALHKEIEAQTPEEYFEIPALQKQLRNWRAA